MDEGKYKFCQNTTVRSISLDFLNRRKKVTVGAIASIVIWGLLTIAIVILASFHSQQEWKIVALWAGLSYLVSIVYSPANQYIK
jgi:hypothetical protein